MARRFPISLLNNAYAAAGNITGDGKLTFGYDDKGRIITSKLTANAASQPIRYARNGLNQRVAKDVARAGDANSDRVLFVYDVHGCTSVAGAGCTGATHLNTPRAITTTDGTLVWRWLSDAYGYVKPDQDADGDGVLFTYNLRFPGQYFDVETGLFYNWHRNYDPMTGRYLEADPIGLDGGLNLYGYVGGNPVSVVDPLGLFELYAMMIDGLEKSEIKYEIYFTPNWVTGLGQYVEKSGRKGIDFVAKVFNLTLAQDPTGVTNDVEGIGNTFVCWQNDSVLKEIFVSVNGAPEGYRFSREHIAKFIDKARKVEAVAELYPWDELLNRADERRRKSPAELARGNE